MAILSNKIFLLSAVVSLVGYFIYSQDAALSNDELVGKTVLVTGASTGIGEQMAYFYSKLGASVVLIARREAQLNAVADKCLELGAAKVKVIPADLGLAENIPRILSEFSGFSNQLDHLILNHKLENHMGPWKGSVQNATQLENIFAANFFGYVRMASAFLPLLEKSGGSIGVVSSAAGRSSAPYIISYSASKHGLDGFFSGLRLELEASNSPVSITFCTLGIIDTENMRKEMATFDFANKDLLFAGLVSARDTAEAIVTAVHRRKRELFFPWAATRIPLLFRFWSPEMFDKMSGFFLKSKFT